MHRKQRRGPHLQVRMVSHQFVDARGKAARCGPTDLQPEAAQNAAHTVLDMLLRAVSTARTSCAASDLQCTSRNQPSRINCAIPRASFPTSPASP